MVTYQEKGLDGSDIIGLKIKFVKILLESMTLSSISENQNSLLTRALVYKVALACFFEENPMSRMVSFGICY